MSIESTSLEQPPRGWRRFTGSDRGRGFRALDSPSFRMILATLTVGQLGFWVSMVAMQTLMAELTDSDPAWLGLLFFMNFSPMLVFTPFAGVLADRFDRRTILVVGFGSMGVVMSTFSFVAAAGVLTAPLMLPFAFCVGTVFAFNGPATQALVAGSVSSVNLTSAITLMSVSVNLSRVVGPALAAPVVAWADEAAAFAIFAVASFTQVGILMFGVHEQPYEREPSDG